MKIKTYTYKTFRNCEIYADVYPAQNSSGLAPTIIWIHGGGLIFGSRKRINPEQSNRYLKIGCNVVSIDYRLAPETKLQSIIEDIKDACKWVRTIGPKLFNGDKDSDVPYQQTVEMAKKLDSVGVENKLIIVPDAGHVFDEEMQSPIIANAFDDVLLFLEKHLKIDRHET